MGTFITVLLVIMTITSIANLALYVWQLKLVEKYIEPKIARKNGKFDSEVIEKLKNLYPDYLIIFSPPGLFNMATFGVVKKESPAVSYTAWSFLKDSFVSDMTVDDGAKLVNFLIPKMAKHITGNAALAPTSLEEFYFDKRNADLSDKIENAVTQGIAGCPPNVSIEMKQTPEGAVDAITADIKKELGASAPTEISRGGNNAKT